MFLTVILGDTLVLLKERERERDEWDILQQQTSFHIRSGHSLQEKRMHIGRM